MINPKSLHQTLNPPPPPEGSCNVFYIVTLLSKPNNNINILDYIYHGRCDDDNVVLRLILLSYLAPRILRPIYGHLLDWSCTMCPDFILEITPSVVRSNLTNFLLDI